MLNQERLEGYDGYIKFSVTVKLCFGESGRNIWNEICKKNEIISLDKNGNEVSNYDAIKNNEQWNTLSLKNKEPNFGALCYWAREDDPELYSKIFGKKTNWDLKGEAEFAIQFNARRTVPRVRGTRSENCQKKVTGRKKVQNEKNSKKEAQRGVATEQDFKYIILFFILHYHSLQQNILQNVK
jgi:hypothetical protein